MTSEHTREKQQCSEWTWRMTDLGCPQILAALSPCRSVLLLLCPLATLSSSIGALLLYLSWGPFNTCNLTTSHLLVPVTMTNFHDPKVMQHDGSVSRSFYLHVADLTWAAFSCLHQNHSHGGGSLHVSVLPKSAARISSATTHVDGNSWQLYGLNGKLSRGRDPIVGQYGWVSLTIFISWCWLTMHLSQLYSGCRLSALSSVITIMIVLNVTGPIDCKVCRAP